MLTWGVCAKEGTATIFCMDCRAKYETVSLEFARVELERVEKIHFCVPSNPLPWFSKIHRRQTS